MTYEISNDNVSWISVGQVNLPAVGSGLLAQTYRVTGLTVVSGRYVRIQVQPPSAAWTLIRYLPQRLDRTQERDRPVFL